MYYIISLQHTRKHDVFVTFWRPNNAGYCMNKESAGTYDEIIQGYHDGEDCLPIKVEDAESLFIQDTKFWGKPYLVIPNTKAVWAKLNVKMTKHGLKKLVIA
jgi:hypothetical protein